METRREVEKQSEEESVDWHSFGLFVERHQRDGRWPSSGPTERRLQKSHIESRSHPLNHLRQWSHSICAVVYEDHKQPVPCLPFGCEPRASPSASDSPALNTLSISTTLSYELFRQFWIEWSLEWSVVSKLFQSFALLAETVINRLWYRRWL